MKTSLFRMMALLLFAVAPAAANAQSMLRDAETEAFLKEITRPIYEAAELTPESVHMYLLADNSINAFVTGGQNIFHPFRPSGSRQRL